MHDLDQPVIEYLTYLEVEKNLAPSTLTRYEIELNLFKNLSLDKGCTHWEEVTHQHLRQYLHYLMVECKNNASTRSRKISCLRGFFSFLYDEGVIQENPCLRIKKPKLEKKLPIYLSIDECERFIQIVKEGSSHQIRDVTIILVFLYTGIRLSELTLLKVSDIDIEARTMRVYGKGRKERLIPLAANLITQLQKYLWFRKHDFEANSVFSPYLFYLYRKQECYHITAGAIQAIFNKYSRLASIHHKQFSAHKLRHTFATLLYNQGANLLEIKQLLGHSNLSTTEIYTHTSSQQLKDAISKHPLPKIMVDKKNS